ncbi:MAG TPA: VWA domain-containing protein [Pyrinomonadaceae bacterium]
MFRLPDAARRVLTALALGSLGVSIAFAAAGAGAQTRRSRRATATPTPTPIVVPRRPPAQRQTGPTPTPTPAIINVPSAQDDAPPPALPTPTPKPTPKPTPTPKPADEVVDETEVVRVTSNLVVVPVAVTDETGNAVQGLKVGDFRLEEEGRAQELSAVGTADEVPLDIALLIDASSSVKDRFDFEKRAAANFLKAVLRPGDRAAVFAIENKSRLVQPLAAADEASVKLLSIPPPPGASFTAFFDAVTEAARYLDHNAPGGHRRVIVALTDGDDTARLLAASAVNNKQKQLDLILKFQQEALREVQRADAVFYSINPSGNTMHLNVRTARSQEGMELVAGSTGGTAFVPASEDKLDAIFRQIAAELRAQYLLQYLSNNQATAGKFLRIKVTSPARPDARIRARQGYFKKG